MAEGESPQARRKFKDLYIDEPGDQSEIRPRAYDEEDLAKSAVVEKRKEGRFGAKYNRIKELLVGNGGAVSRFTMGFKMGATVGVIIGALFGVRTLITHRNPVPMFIGAIAMGGSFGFFMGLGSVLRSAPAGAVFVQHVAVFRDGKWTVEAREPLWKTQYRISS